MGDSIVIRSAEPADAERISELMGSSGVFEQLLQMPDVPVASRIETLRVTDAQICRLVALDGDRVVAHAGLHKTQNSIRRQHVRGLGIAIASSHQGQGLGRALMERLLRWADGWGAVLRIELTVNADNERAIALYSRLGFMHEGRHLAYALRNGQYVDAIAMARMHPCPPMLPAW
ncbi:GNAT family N-acetyltransferase [Variovorax sp. OV329]|uniref:GNAT family N-acetyltransferase n=1 Tax=Variovorax sp. OV329 TaxID=1882825 RepID=UPI0008E6B2E8|nr:GNAT family N-acetyltransferase [Variovorax sp. OV329]SFN39480.1 putative acetyltransferase [Variovorax sp. OV329]